MRIPLGLSSGLPADPGPSLRRREKLDEGTLAKIVVPVVLALLVLIVILLFSFRASRLPARNSKSAKSSRGRFLTPTWRTRAGRDRYLQAQAEPSTSTEQFTPPRTSRPSSFALDPAAASPQAVVRSPNRVVNRNPSLRSIMTLPPYRPQPGDNERVLGREGERAGVDVVIEYPTEEDEEALRDREMETLYQIRVARRREHAEQAGRRRERREARQRGDLVALNRIGPRAVSDNHVVAVLLEEHERLKDERQRAVSSVWYDALGVARHDGSRLRANSTESERIGLLSDCASMTAASIRSGAESVADYSRGRSASSVMSVESDLASPAFASRLRPNSRPDTPRLNTGVSSGPEIIEVDVGEVRIPIYSPPGYDDVSLGDEPSRGNTPQPATEPPPHYPGPALQPTQQGFASSMAGVVGDERTRRGLMGLRRQSVIPQLPSLRLHRLPRIVIEPSSARPHDDS